MSSPGVVLHVLWKEYRQHRAFWLVLAMCAALIQFLIVWTFQLERRQLELAPLFNVSVVFSCLFAIGCGALLFAEEHDAQTFDLLRAWPITARQLFWGKFLCGVGGQLSLALVLCLSASVFARNQNWEVDVPAVRNFVSSALVTSLGFFAVGMLFSLLTRRPLWALIAAGCIGTALFFVLAPVLAMIVTPLDHRPTSFAAYRHALPFHILFAVTLLAVDYWLARGWLRPEQSWRLVSWLRPAARLERTGSEIWGQWMKGLMHLVWQTWLQSWGLMLGAIGLAAVHAGLHAMPLRFANAKVVTEVDVVFLPTIFFAAVMGSCVFLGDQRRNGFRFFAERGISPQLVWLARHLAWGGVLVSVLIMSLMLVAYLNSSASFALMNYQNRWEFVGLACVAYAAGQIGSLYSRSGVIGLSMGLFAALLSCMWCTLMYRIRVPLIWSAAPLPVIFLWITWLRAPDWVTERSSWHATAKALLSFSPLLVLAVAVAAFRVYEVPTASIPNLQQASRIPTKEERVTAGLYREAADSLRWVKSDPNKMTSDEAQSWDTALTKFLEASRRPSCRFAEPVSSDWYGLVSAVLSDPLDDDLSARRAAQLERYVAVIRFARHLYENQSVALHWQADSAELRALERFVAWCAHDTCTAGEIRHVIERLERECFAYRPQRNDFVYHEYFVRSRDLEVLFGQSSWLKFLPWERARLRRLLAYKASSIANSIGRAESNISQMKAYDAVDVFTGLWWDTNSSFERLIETSVSVEPASELAGTVTLNADGINRWDMDVALDETRRRAAHVRLHLLLSRKEHGTLPDSLDALSGNRLAKLILTDPFSGQPFVYQRFGFPEELGDMPAQTPFIWSTGPNIEQRPISVRESRYYSRQFPSARSSAYPILHPITGRDLWQKGLLFKIPVPADAIDSL